MHSLHLGSCLMCQTTASIDLILNARSCAAVVRASVLSFNSACYGHCQDFFTLATFFIGVFYHVDANTSMMFIPLLSMIIFLLRLWPSSLCIPGSLLFFFQDSGFDAHQSAASLVPLSVHSQGAGHEMKPSINCQELSRLDLYFFPHQLIIPAGYLMTGRAYMLRTLFFPFSWLVRTCFTLY